MEGVEEVATKPSYPTYASPLQPMHVRRLPMSNANKRHASSLLCNGGMREVGSFPYGIWQFPICIAHCRDVNEGLLDSRLPIATSGQQSHVIQLLGDSCIREDPCNKPDPLMKITLLQH